MIKYLWFIFAIFISSKSISQKFSDKILLEFLSEQGDLQSTTNDQLDIVYTIDVVKLSHLTNNEVGVFRFGVVASHANAYFLLNEKNKFTFFDLKNIENDLFKLIPLLRDIKCYNAKEKLNVIENFVVTYKSNLDSSPWVDKK